MIPITKTDFLVQEHRFAVREILQCVIDLRREYDFPAFPPQLTVDIFIANNTIEAYEPTEFIQMYPYRKGKRLGTLRAN